MSFKVMCGERTEKKNAMNWVPFDVYCSFKRHFHSFSTRDALKCSFEREFN